MKINKLKEQIKKTAVKSIVIGTTLVSGASIPAYADGMDTLSINGMDNVASSLQNVVKYVGLFFIAGGAITAFYGAYKIFQSIKSQDSESRSTAILEFASGLGAIAVGAGAAAFSGYIKVIS